MIVITIGRKDDNDIVVNDVYVGRNHCKLIKDEQGSYYIVDLGSTNGTYVNGMRISESVKLSINDIIRIGNTTLPWQSYFIDVPHFFEVTIKRDDTYFGKSDAFDVIIDGTKVKSMHVGDVFYTKLPWKCFNLLIHKDGVHAIDKEFTINPEEFNGGAINCVISTKPNLLGILSIGLLAPTCKLEFVYSGSTKKNCNPINYNFRNIKDMNNIILYSTLHLKENHLFYSYIHNNFQDCEIAAKVPARQVFANAPEYAMPINFLITKGDKKTVILLVNGSKCKRYSVLETMELCKENGITPLRFIIDTGLPNEEQYVVDRIRKTLQ